MNGKSTGSRVFASASILRSMLLVWTLPVIGTKADEGVNFFEKEIRPLLSEHCYECHSAKSKRLKGGLRLDSREGILSGGDSGPAAVVGEPESSRLVAAVSGHDKDLEMPPKKPLRTAQIEVLTEWVRRGLPAPRQDVAASKPGSGMSLEEGRKFWSYQPVSTPALPTVKHPEWVQAPLDSFVVAGLEAAGLNQAPKADKRTLLRRATFDLTGLPPSPGETDAFLADSAPDAFARVVDRLLASSSYGERWGRQWLDVVRYADTCGNASDYPIPQAALYRDWVIKAANKDMPYDEFLREQIAGDLLPSDSDETRTNRIVATGYIAMARRFGGVGGEPHLTIDDTIDNLSRAILGSSIACARCHNHKFDPFTMEDYYGLYGFFSSTRYPNPGGEGGPRQTLFVPLIGAAEVSKISAPFEAELAAAQAVSKALEAAQEPIKAAPDSPEKTEASARLKAKFEEAKKALAEVLARMPIWPDAYAVVDGPSSGNAKIQIRGEPKNLGAEVRRKFPAILGGMQLAEGTKGSGRMELAKWLSSPTNPLTARVLVNRVWQQHFGTGIVSTPNDFGRQGQAPSHPELLDYLASRFIADGWSLKALHRSILLSRTWQLSSEATAEALEKDPSNKLLSRATRRRLDAESLRDSLLFVSGQLQLTPAGAHPFPARHTWKWTQHNPFSETYESYFRSVYLMQSRLRKNPYLNLFDGADPSSSTGVRRPTTTPLQSLFSMNSPLMHQCSEAFVLHRLGGAPEGKAKLRAAYVNTLGRSPTPTEERDALEFLEVYQKALLPADSAEAQGKAWSALARSLLATNEFLFID